MRAAAAGDNLREQILAVYDYLWEWLCTKSFPGCAYINGFGELSGIRPEVAQLVCEHKEPFQRFIAGHVCELVAPDSLASQLSMLAEGAQGRATIARDPSVASRAKSAAVRLIDTELAGSAAIRRHG